MDIESLKENILENDLIPVVLEEVGCHHIKHRDGFYQCANPDGDNTTAVCVYENTNLTTINYTRDITNGRKGSDLISLVEFYKNETFPHAIKWICDVLDIDYYSNPEDELPESLKLTKMLLDLQENDNVEEEEKPLKPISERILSYYKPYVNNMFLEDNVGYDTQSEFEIGYDEESNRITIPIRDDLGNLVGVKARYFYRKVPEDTMKFIYLEKCARSQILYGLYKTINFIKQKKRVFVVEAEKGVQQLWDAGYQESVATGGKKITQCQINKLTRLCVPIIFVFDKDVEKEELDSIAKRFIDEVEIYALIDKDDILSEKESPTDNIEKFEQLLDKNIYKLR
ncbi:DNA primase [Lachnospiraceae bacterium SGI.054]